MPLTLASALLDMFNTCSNLQLSSPAQQVAIFRQTKLAPSQGLLS